MSVETINSLQDYIAAVERTLDASCSEEVSLMRGAICDIEAAETRCEKLKTALTQCAEWFEEYGKGHEAKYAKDKADRNFRRAAFIHEKIKDSEL